MHAATRAESVSSGSSAPPGHTTVPVIPTPLTCADPCTSERPLRRRPDDPTAREHWGRAAAHLDGTPPRTAHRPAPAARASRRHRPRPGPMTSADQTRGSLYRLGLRHGLSGQPLAQPPRADQETAMTPASRRHPPNPETTPRAARTRSRHRIRNERGCLRAVTHRARGRGSSEAGRPATKARRRSARSGMRQARCVRQQGPGRRWARRSTLPRRPSWSAR
jgi:hypothetical protein